MLRMHLKFSAAGFGGYLMLFMISVGLIILIIIGYVVWRAVNWGGVAAELVTTDTTATEETPWKFCDNDTPKEKSAKNNTSR